MFKLPRKIQLWVNRFRIGYAIRRKSGNLRIVVPESERRVIRLIKYFLGIVGLISAFFAFATVWQSFFFGLLLFLLGAVLEKTVFAHVAFYVHALPQFEVDPDKWTGVGFGYAQPPDRSALIPIVGMMITDLDFAKELNELFLTWTFGEHNDTAGNVKLSVVVLSPEEYVFLAYPNPFKEAAKEAMKEAEEDLRKKSLEDELIQMHAFLTLGKRCKILPGSFFPDFRRKWKPGVPVMFGFWVPPHDKGQFHPDLDQFVMHNFSIKDRSELTRKDFEYEMYGTYERGGKWQGPSNSR